MADINTKVSKGLLGTKLGMTQVWDENGKLVPVTVIEVAPNVQHEVADASRPQAQRNDEPDDAPAARRADRTQLRADDGVGLRLGLVDVPPHAVVVDVVHGEDGDVGRHEK